MSTSVVMGVLALSALGCLFMWGAGASAGRKAQKKVREVNRTGSVLMWSLVCTGVIVGVQWVVVTQTTDPAWFAVVLGVPGLLAGTTLARLCAVTIGANGRPADSSNGW